MPSGRATIANPWFTAVETSIDVGAATRNYYGKVDQVSRFEALQYSADACDSTDKYTPELAYKGPNDSAFTVISTGTVLTTADAVTDYTTLDSTAPPGGLVPAGSTIRLKLTFAGTPGNVTGIRAEAKFSIGH